MPNPRKLHSYYRVHADDTTFPADATIVVPVITAQGFSPAISAQVGLAVALVNTGQLAPLCGLGEAGDQLLGKVMAVDLDGTVTVQDEGYMYLPFNTTTVPVPGGFVVVDGTGKVQRSATQSAANEVQTITMTPTGGTWTFTAPNLGTTAALAWNISNANLQTALRALYGGTNVTVTNSGTIGTPTWTYILTFGSQMVAQDVPVGVVDPALLTGGTATIAETTQGSPATGGAATARCFGFGLDPSPVGFETTATTLCIVKI